LYSPPNIIMVTKVKEHEMSEAYSVRGRDEKFIQKFRSESVM